MPGYRLVRTLIVSLVLVIAADLTSKLLVLKIINPYGLWLTNKIGLQLAFNQGLAFGLGKSIIAFTLSILITVVLLFLTFRLIFKTTPNRIIIIALGMILGGAIGNIIDRSINGQVTDFIAIGPWPNFNLADSAIVIGVISLLWQEFNKPKEGN